MADESPEQIRERVLAEELEKGSDPRVAEGRSKAAELRAQQGLPIDPQEAWKAKLEKEGGPRAPAAEDAPAPTPEEPEEPAEAAEAAEEKAPEPSEQPEPAAAESEEKPAAAESEEKPAAAAPAPAAAEAPMPEGVQREADAPAELARVTVAPPAVVEPPKPTEFEPEIGELVEFETEEMGELAGIKMADAPLASWLIAVFVALVAIAAIYLVVFSGAGVSEQASGCRIAEDRTIVCSETGPGEAE
ncbi:MAG: hypothetical protein KY429_00040 [Actinobacteria bacterium]|nr:hypothetical protein [Actinomycetota bacterium]